MLSRFLQSSLGPSLYASCRATTQSKLQTGTSAASQTRGAANIKIEWVPPPHVPSIDPKKSGDMEPLPKLDLSKHDSLLSLSEELKTASPEVQRLVSLEFGPFRKAVKLFKAETLAKIQRHKLDTGSMESTIACLTIRIRSLQQHMISGSSQDKLAKVNLKEMIEYRRKLLRHLRRMDYKRFEWILEKLNLAYRPPPTGDRAKVTRVRSLQMLTKIYSDSVREKRLEAYRKQLQSQQPAFLKEKEETQKWIEQEEKELGLK